MTRWMTGWSGVSVMLFLLASLGAEAASYPSSTAIHLPVEEAFEKVSRIYGPELSPRKLQLRLTLDTEGETSVARIRIQNQFASIAYNAEVAAADSGLGVDHWSFILCHEVGHLLGGAPYIQTHPDDGGDASTEGQADYFAAAKCLKRIWPEGSDETALLVRSWDPDTVRLIRQQGCESDQCVRIVKRVFETFLWLDPDSVLKLDRRSKFVARFTHSNYFALPDDCRLDTALAGALCPVDPLIPFSTVNQRDGSCTKDDPSPLNRRGARPVCWFNPVSLDRSI